MHAHIMHVHTYTHTHKHTSTHTHAHTNRKCYACRHIEIYTHHYKYTSIETENIPTNSVKILIYASALIRRSTHEFILVFSHASYFNII